MLLQGHSSQQTTSILYMSANLASMTKTVLTTGSFAQGYSGVKGLFLPCKLWNGGVEEICENVNCLAI